MITKKTLLANFLLECLKDVKVGIIVKGLTGIKPEDVIVELSSRIENHLYIAAIGYGSVVDKENEDYTITPSVEKAVLWRSIPKYAGQIVVFIKNDSDKLHSLAEFETFSARDLTNYLFEMLGNCETSSQS